MIMATESDQDRDKAIEQEIRMGREFTIADLLRQEGGDFLKGESPVPKLVQVITEIKGFIKQNLKDSYGSLSAVLQTYIQDDKVTVSRYLDQPLKALESILENFLNHPPLLYELVRQVDSRWGQMYKERPHFQEPGQPPHPEDVYTHESVAIQLTQLLEKVRENLGESS